MVVGHTRAAVTRREASTVRSGSPDSAYQRRHQKEEGEVERGHSRTRVIGPQPEIGSLQLSYRPPSSVLSG